VYERAGVDAHEWVGVYVQGEMEGGVWGGVTKARGGGEEKVVEMCGTHHVCTDTRIHKPLQTHTLSRSLSHTHTCTRAHTCMCWSNHVSEWSHELSAVINPLKSGYICRYIYIYMYIQIHVFKYTHINKKGAS